MTWLVAGAGGMLGTDLVAALRATGAEVHTPSSKELDLREAEAVREAVHRIRPATVVNCAAWMAVDDAEEHEAEALAINGTAVQSLAAACGETGARLFQVSTDYVFDGTSPGPYPEDALTAPVNAYGRTKLVGERTALGLAQGYVVRTAWLYGAHGGNFVRTMARLAGERETVDVVDDQWGQPTWTVDLADQIIALAGSKARAGVYHATSSGRTTWCGLAREVFTLLGLDPARVRPTTSDKFPRPARRPANSVLAHDGWASADLPPIRDWRTALHAAWPTLS